MNESSNNIKLACGFAHRLLQAMRRAKLPALFALALLAGQAQAITLVSNFGSNPGNLTMYKYIPANLPANAPLVMATHGCTMSAAAYDTEPGIIKYADLWKFAVVWAEQKPANQVSRCFNWWLTGDSTRGQGEALSAKQMIDKMKADHSIDASRVFITGLSAGAAFTTMMLATYPDVFSAGAPIAGVSSKCDLACSQGLIVKTPQQWGDMVRTAGPAGYTGPYPRVSIWHGSADATVNPGYVTEIMKQWTNVHGIDQTADLTDTISDQAHNVYKDAGGVSKVETVMVAGMGHGTPIGPGSATQQCGTAASYILNVGLCSHYHIFKWFGLGQ
ncbi:MAG: PHB depolymerase family esterase [Pseudomonadota bacterium]